VFEHDAKERFVEFTEIWGEKYPAILRLWENARSEFTPFLDYSPEALSWARTLVNALPDHP
jgi:transposase-like protein